MKQNLSNYKNYVSLQNVINFNQTVLHDKKLLKV